MPSSYAIGDHFEQFIKTQLESGRYSSASEVVRDALRLMEEREQNIKEDYEKRKGVIEAVHTQKHKAAEAIAAKV